MKHCTCTLQFVKTYPRFRFPVVIEKMILKGLYISLLDVNLTVMNSCALPICKLELVFFGRGVLETVTPETRWPSRLSNSLECD